MKSVLTLLLLVLSMPAFIFIAIMGYPFLACMLMFGAIALNTMVIIKEAEHFTPRCNECGRPLEEGTDTNHEDSLKDSH